MLFPDTDLFLLTVSIQPQLPVVNLISIGFLTRRKLSSLPKAGSLGASEPTSTNRRSKGPRTPEAIEPNDFLKQVMVGLMLGDLNAERNFLNGNTRLRFYQSNVNKLYIYHLYSIFKPYVKTAPKEPPSLCIRERGGALLEKEVN